MRKFAEPARVAVIACKRRPELSIDCVEGLPESGKQEALRVAMAEAQAQFASATPPGQAEADPVMLVDSMCQELKDWLHGLAATAGASGWEQMEMREAAEAAAAARESDRAAELDAKAQAEAEQRALAQLDSMKKKARARGDGADATTRSRREEHWRRALQLSELSRSRRGLHRSRSTEQEMSRPAPDSTAAAIAPPANPHSRAMTPSEQEQRLLAMASSSDSRHQRVLPGVANPRDPARRGRPAALALKNALRVAIESHSLDAAASALSQQRQAPPLAAVIAQQVRRDSFAAMMRPNISGGAGSDQAGLGSAHTHNGAEGMALVQLSAATEAALVLPTPATSSRFLMDFVIERRLGRGAFGRVLQAVNRMDRQQYAVKVIPLPRKRRKKHATAGDRGDAEIGAGRLQLDRKLMREVTTLSRLTHPHVVRYFNAWIEDGAVDGDPADVLKKGGGDGSDDEVFGDSESSSSEAAGAGSEEDTDEGAQSGQETASSSTSRDSNSTASSSSGSSTSSSNSGESSDSDSSDDSSDDSQPPRRLKEASSDPGFMFERSETAASVSRAGDMPDQSKDSMSGLNDFLRQPALDAAVIGYVPRCARPAVPVAPTAEPTAEPGVQYREGKLLYIQMEVGFAMAQICAIRSGLAPCRPPPPHTHKIAAVDTIR